MPDQPRTPEPTASRRAHRDPAATREALLGAATELFAERGFDGARVDAIARRAGVNKAMINYYFGGKQGLYSAIVASTLGQLHERLGAPALAGHAGAPEQLRRFIAAFAGIATERPMFPAMMLREMLSGGRHIDAEVVSHFLSVLGRVRAIIAQGVEDGSFRAVDPLLTHLTLIGSLVFFFATQPARAHVFARDGLSLDTSDAGAFVRHLQDLMTAGLAAGVPHAAAPSDFSRSA